MVAGKLCNVYHVENPDSCNDLIDSFYCYEDGRVLYHYLSDSNFFTPLYDFNLGPGDSLITSTREGKLITYIDSVGLMKTEDTVLSIQFVHYTVAGIMDQPVSLWIRHARNNNFNIEGIGNTYCFFPWWAGLCHNVRATNLRCFEGKSHSYYYGEWEGHCDSVYFWDYQSTSEIGANRISIYPNPSTGEIYLNRSLEDQTQIIIVNALGQQVFTTSVIGSSPIRLDLNALPKGPYVLLLNGPEGRSSTSLVLY